jgi:hypothetical protein
MQHFSYVPSFGIPGTYSPTPRGLATFSAAPAIAWPVVANTYVGVAQRLLVAQSALT